MGKQIIKIGVFYDGSYFSHVSNYYAYYHPRRERISIGGLHEFIRNKVATKTDPVQYCQIVDAHYFRGRHCANVMQSKGLLKGERQFEDVLMNYGVTTHYWPITDSGEKGVDVAFALHAYESALSKRYDVCVLVAGDGDYVPLVRKLHGLGIRVMVCGWSFEFVDERGISRATFASKALLSAASDPLNMSEQIEELLEDLRAGDREAAIVEKLFVGRSNAAEFVAEDPEEAKEPWESEDSLDAYHFAQHNGQAIERTRIYSGEIVLLNQGWGFLHPDSGDTDIFFHYADLIGMDFDELRLGDKLSYTLDSNEKGPLARKLARI